MKLPATSICRLVLSIVTGWVALAAPALAQSASQTLTLLPGWNAIWLEVEPVYPAGQPRVGQPKAPTEVFSDPAIDIVATPKPLAGSSEFFGSEPGTITTFNKDDWQQWRRTDPAGASNLAAIFGNRPYLVRIAGTATVNLSLTGNVRFFRPTWTPDRYNLLGFGLDGTRTFDEFFSASGTKHQVDKIFKLSPDGSWVRVSAGENMASGKAFWIFSAGPSTYMGPVAVDFDHSVTGAINYGGPSDAEKVGTEMLDLEELVFTNYGTAAVTPTATALATDAGLTLNRVTPAATGLSYVLGNGFLSAFVPVASKQTVTLTIGARRTFGDDAIHTSLYRLRTSTAGASFYLPVTAVKSDFQQTAATTGGVPPGPVTGLWVGDVVVDSSTSIVVDGSPKQPTVGTAPIRILVHSDADGTVRLLSQVTLMQTKTADPAVPGTPVLVVDPARIPIFEGIKTRDDKKMGVRIEAVAYDMPRSASAWSGADLVTFANRPTALQEVYDLTRTMTGVIGQTVSATLTLDPFHRSNPLRHVYHQDLTKGPKITRTITLAFDAAQTVPDRLSGSFSDEIKGLIKDNLTLTGRIELRRVSPVATLQGQ
jgi:hypothetical protein